MEAETPRKSRSLWPKEHGAYAQLLGPLAVALIHGPIEAPGAAIALASVLTFVAHEPLLVTLGLRGPRALEEAGKRARGLALALGAVALALGAFGLVTGPRAALLGAIAPLALTLVLAVLIKTKRERTLVGEVTAALALSSAAAPVALASGVEVPFVVASAFAFGLGFTANTIAVRGVIARQKGRAGVPPSLLLFVVSVALAGAGSVFGWPGLAALPLVAASWILVAAPPPARQLRAVGFVLVGAMAVSAALLLAIDRPEHAERSRPRVER
jgi:hypothetical protein